MSTVDPNIKIGSRVRIVSVWSNGGNDYDERIGIEGTITELDDDKRPYRVHFGPGDVDWVWAARVVLIGCPSESVEIKASTLNELMTRHNTSAIFAVELFHLLGKMGVEVDWKA